jgi:hypothetical protein
MQTPEAAGEVHYYPNDVGLIGSLMYCAEVRRNLKMLGAYSEFVQT